MKTLINHTRTLLLNERGEHIPTGLHDAYIPIFLPLQGDSVIRTIDSILFSGVSSVEGRRQRVAELLHVLIATGVWNDLLAVDPRVTYTPSTGMLSLGQSGLLQVIALYGRTPASIEKKLWSVSTWVVPRDLLLKRRLLGTSTLDRFSAFLVLYVNYLTAVYTERESKTERYYGPGKDWPYISGPPSVDTTTGMDDPSTSTADPWGTTTTTIDPDTTTTSTTSTTTIDPDTTTTTSTTSTSTTTTSTIVPETTTTSTSTVAPETTTTTTSTTSTTTVAPETTTTTSTTSTTTTTTTTTTTSTTTTTTTTDVPLDPTAISLTAYSAVSLLPIVGATVSIFSQTLGTVVATGTTDGSGAFYAEVAAGAGTCVATVSATGYATWDGSVTVVSNTTNYVEAYASPVLVDEEYRIVLTWGATPEDLDSHLTGPMADASTFHLYYESGWRYVEPGTEAPGEPSGWISPEVRSIPGNATLDVDDMDGYGPETVTITAVNPGVYRFAVHDYTNMYTPDSTFLGESGAMVKLYRSNGSTLEFTVPPGAGNLWNVFEIDSVTGVVTDISLLSGGTTEPSDINGGGFANTQLEDGSII